jgi:hypothetical protein
MPTNLPDGFTGTKQPEPEETPKSAEGMTPGEWAAFLFIGLPVVGSFIFALVGALCFLGMWCFTHLP